MKRALVLYALLVASSARAGNLTLPFKNQATPLWQGWIYDTGGYHGGIDYGCSCGTEIVAAADGYAISWYQPYDPRNPKDYSYGEYVLMYHPSSSRYTLYAHLSSWASNIPRINRTTYAPGTGWVWLTRGTKVGNAGKTGTQVCHLHFEVSSGGYATGREDPYGLYKKVYSYPGCGTNTGTYQFTQCPPVVSGGGGGGCTTNGQFVDITRAADFNGDGKFEIARFYADTGRWDVMLSSGTNFLPLQTWYACGHGTNSTWQGVGDMNGDGKDDALVYFESSGRAYVALSTGAGFAGYYEATSAVMMQGMQNKFLGDVDGDGRDDFIGFNSGNWYVARSNGSKFQWPQWGILNFGAGSTKRLVGDITGDGRVDALCVYKSSGYGQWAWGHGSTADDWDLVDVDGNHAKDAAAFWHYFAPWPGAVIVWNSYGLGAGGFHQNNNFRTCGQSGGSSKRIYADFNGDGREDYAFYYSSTGWNVATSDGFSFWPASRW